MRSFFFFLPKDDTIWKVKVFGSFFVSLYMIEEKKQKIYVFFFAGMRNWLSRQAHNLNHVGSNPTPAHKMLYS